MKWIDDVKFNSHGLIPAVMQDYKTNELLMVAYMNKEAIEKTLKYKKTHFYSRSRKKMWLKGESSGHTQEVKSIFIDCDMDCLLIKVKQKGGACHTGFLSCFYRELKGDEFQEVGKKVFNPDDVY